MNRRVLSIRDTLRTVLFLGLVVGICTTSTAQGFRGGGPPSSGGPPGGGGGFPSPEDSFRRMDRNQNGQIDPEEIPSFLRDMYAKAGMDVSRPISQQVFIEGSQKVREQFEKARSSGDFSQFRRPEGGGGPPGSSGGSPGSGGPPSFSFRSESDRSDSRRPEESSRDDRGRDERGRESSSSGKSTKKAPKPKARVTQDLPADYLAKDKNGDGQIGLYEWDRNAFSQFFSLDRNGDGLLTPIELIAAAKTSPSSDKSSSQSITSTSPAAPSVDSRSTSSTSNSTKSGDSSSATTASASSSPGLKSFVSLDSNRDGKLSEDEWRRSRTTRGKFEKAKIELKFPVEQAQFVELYDKVEAQ